MKPLVFLEHRRGRITPGSLGVLSKTRSVAAGSPVAAVLGGASGMKELVAEAGAHGADRVHLAEHESLAQPLAQQWVEIVEQAVRAGTYDTVLLSNSVLAADVAAGVAARLDAGVNWDLVDVEVRSSRLVGRQLAFADSVLAETGWRSDVAVALFRAGVFPVAPADGAGSEPDVVDVAVEAPGRPTTARVLERRPATEEGPALDTAEVVVSGGMGLGAAEHFRLAEDLASELGGVVGATRAAVYAGWYPPSAQVGQTGRTVSPKLYVALGISGAIQHQVGMQRSQVVVSVNTDPGAPIFDVSDLAVVGDVHVVAPALVELLRRRREG